MYSRCILSVSYAEDEIHQNTSRIHHDTRIHTLTHGPTRAPLGYTGIQQDTTGYIRSCVSPRVAHVGYMGNTCCHDVSYRSGRDTCGIHSGYVLDTEKHVYLGREYQTHAGYMRDTCRIHSGYMFKGCIFARLVGYMRNPCWIQLANMYP